MRSVLIHPSLCCEHVCDLIRNVLRLGQGKVWVTSTGAVLQ